MVKKAAATKLIQCTNQLYFIPIPFFLLQCLLILKWWISAWNISLILSSWHVFGVQDEWTF